MKETCAVVLVLLVGPALASGCSCSGNVGTEGHDSGGDVGALADSALDGARDDTGVTMDSGALVDASRGSVHVATCPGCPCFPGTDCTGSANDAGTTPPACTASGSSPVLVYPPDQVLLPPNTGVVEVQFLPGAGNTLFEIDFANVATDVRLITTCNDITNTRGGATGGCGFVVSPTQWAWIADVNRGGAPLHVTVRAVPADASCVATSDTRDISFATEDVVGAVYYWQSVTVGGVPGRAGGIYRFDFGRTDEVAEPFLESSATTGNRCYGCHFVSRDGLRISYGSDDPDSDDEYGDLFSYLMDISTRSIATPRIPPGFRTFSSDHSSMLDSDGPGGTVPPAMFRIDGTLGTTLDRPRTVARVTHPDWSDDDSRVVFAQPASFLDSHGAVAPTADDDHFFNASLYMAAWSGSALGTPAPLLMAASVNENNFYPAFTPGGGFVVFDRVLGHTGVAGDAYSNPAARIWAMPTSGGTPVDLATLNMGDGLTNSWPRMSPFAQADRGHQIIWVTFSSTRDYGLHVVNQDAHGVSCYPPESPENPATSHSCSLVPATCSCTSTTCPDFCVQPQIWMAAIEIDAAGGISAGRDTSHPAFWLPFQEVTAHNHIAQWATGIPGRTPPSDAGVDAGPVDASRPTCGGAGDRCGAGAPLCCAAYYCSAAGTCATLM